MKKYLLLVIFLIGLTSFAQKPEFGIKGGINIASATADGTDAPNIESLVGIHVGFFMDVKLKNKFSFQPEFLYSMQGGQFDQAVNYEGTIYNTSNKLKFSYINIPLMLKYHADPKFYLEFGPQLGFLTSSELETSVLGQTVGQDFKEYMKSTDFALNLGLGYEISKKVVLSGRYSIGLSNTLDPEPGDNSEMKNRVLSFSLGYKF